MVEWESQQASPILTQPQDVMSAAGLNYIYDLASSVAERWLTTDITSLHQEANTIQNSFLNTEHNVHNGLSVRCIVQNATVLNEDNIHVPPNVLNIPNSSLMDINNSNNFYDSMDVNTDITLPIDEYVETGTLSLWGSPMDLDHLKMDDVFQVDKADLFQGPTLAELNANDESLFDSLDSFDQCLPSDNKEAQTVKSSKSHTVTLSSASAFLSDLNYSDCDLKITHSSSKSFSVKVENQYAKDTVQIEKSPALPLFVSSSESETNSKFNKDASAPIVENFESNIHEAKCRPVVSESADYQTYLTNKNPAVVAGKERHLKTEETKNDESHINQINDFECENPCNLSSLSNDEGFDSQDENSDNDYLFSSEGESGDEMGEDISHNWSAAGDKWVGNKKKTRYFWQYNIQSKGPKGPKVKLSKNSPNPHCITDVGDPVFSTVCRVEGVKHAGKARRGDGNDLTPNPRKLYNIGMELQKLSSVINDLTPVNELPFNARPKSRKEKNKLASRACRLKKKAQHEANKLKFFGLQQEQRSLLGVLTETKKIVKIKLQDIRSQEESCEEKMETLLSKKDFTKVAGSSAEFVNKVLDKVASGDPNGGLSRLQVL